MLDVRRRGAGALAAWTISIALGAGAAPAAEIIDRIVAVVNGSVVTLSDVDAALRFGLVAPAPTGERLQGAIEPVIERRLVLAEIDRYAPPEPRVEQVEAAVDAIRTRFASPAEFDAALAATGMTLDRLRSEKRDELRLQSYLQGRFGYALQPSEDDVVAYYRSHAPEFTREGVLRPYEEVRDEARAKLVESRRTELVREWMAGLRRRAEVTILPQGPRAGG